jgi:hypothetical protein
MAVATRTTVRDPLADHLITPQNSAMVLIDYQPSQIAAVRSINQDLLLKNAVSTTMACELQRDSAREETVAGVIEIVLAERLLKE